MYSSIRIASRNTPLAKVQTYLVYNELKKLKTIKHLDVLFRDIPEVSNQSSVQEVISANFKKDLKSDQIDLAVHSHKNLELETSHDTEVISVLRRADQRDIILIKKSSLLNPPDSLSIFSSYPLKEKNYYQFLKEYSPISLRNKDFTFHTIQGSITSRIEKWEAGGDGIILAKGSLDYLLLDNYPQADEEDIKLTREYIKKILQQSQFIVIPLSQCPSDPGQGGIALEFKKGRKDLQNIANALSIYSVREEIEQEREVAKSAGSAIQVSYLKRGYGTVIFKKGTTPEGDTIVHQEIKTSHQPKAIAISRVYPIPEEIRKNIRKPLEGITHPPEGNLFLIKKNSWLSHWEKSDVNGILWAAYLSTFKALTDNDFWVSGCSDGLGEEEDPNLHGYLSNSNFIKLSHTDSSNVPSRYERFATYSLKLNSFPDLRERTHFFWMSGFQFDTAVNKYPQIVNGFHASCPGITRNYIQKKVKAPVDTFLTYEDWYNYHITFK